MPLRLSGDPYTMIAAIKSKIVSSVSEEITSAFQVFNTISTPGVFNEGNPELAYVTMLLILILVGVCVVGNFASISAFGKTTSTPALS